MTGVRRTAVVVGGGLAGLAAAVRLAQDTKTDVTLVEARPRLGGATHSFDRDGLVVDNGQHVFLRCYTEYLDFLHRVGAGGDYEIQPRFHVPVLRRDGKATELRRSGLPAPLHLAGALNKYELLTPKERRAAVFAALKLRRLDPDDPALDERSFGDWLRQNGQGKASIDALWNLFTVAALNTSVDEASFALAVRVFKTGLLTHRDAADIGIPTVPLGELHGDRAAAALTAAGATVRLGTRVRTVTSTETGLKVELEERGETSALDADLVIVATPHEQAAEILPADAKTTPFEGLGGSPIVNIHVWYDRKVIDEPFVAMVGSPVQWVFDRTDISRAGSGQYLAVSLSGAEQEIDTPVNALRETYLPELEHLLPAAREAQVKEFFVTRERRATFRQRPGTRALRPAPLTGTAGLLLAGAWVATGWPDTMEGAVRSGYEAARLGIQHLTSDESGKSGELSGEPPEKEVLV